MVMDIMKTSHLIHVNQALNVRVDAEDVRVDAEGGSSGKGGAFPEKKRV